MQFGGSLSGLFGTYTAFNVDGHGPITTRHVDVGEGAIVLLGGVWMEESKN